jgi:8-oxo-dGTP diphosphatase
MQPVSVGILMRNGEVLVCQRKRTARYPLKWEFPGGKIEANESVWQALVRELREELNIEALGGSEFHRQEWIYPEGVADTKKDGAFRVFYYLVSSFSGEPTNLVFEQIRWVSPAALKDIDLLEGNREAVNCLVAQHPSLPGTARPL